LGGNTGVEAFRFKTEHLEEKLSAGVKIGITADHLAATISAKVENLGGSLFDPALPEPDAESHEVAVSTSGLTPPCASAPYILKRIVLIVMQRARRKVNIILPKTTRRHLTECEMEVGLPHRTEQGVQETISG
jgi:hypothetical protein